MFNIILGLKKAKDIEEDVVDVEAIDVKKEQDLTQIAADEPQVKLITIIQNLFIAKKEFLSLNLT